MGPTVCMREPDGTTSPEGTQAKLGLSWIASRCPRIGQVVSVHVLHSLWHVSLPAADSSRTTSKMGPRKVYEPQYLHPTLLVNLTAWFTHLKRQAEPCSAAFSQPARSRPPRSLRLQRNGNSARSTRYAPRSLGTLSSLTWQSSLSQTGSRPRMGRRPPATPATACTAAARGKVSSISLITFNTWASTPSGSLQSSRTWKAVRETATRTMGQPLRR